MAITLAKNNTKERKALDMKAGDTVKVHQKIQEKGKTRIQIFEGLVLSRKHGAEAGATFTVRKSSNGWGVERIFPLHSPMIDKIEVLRRSKTRRSKLYFIRDKAAKEISKRMKTELIKARAGIVDEVVEAEAVEVK
ncbi:MAG: 50S ribosomal protein L19 [bacterium]